MKQYPYSRRCRQCQGLFDATGPNDHFCSIPCKFTAKMSTYFPDGLPPQDVCWEWPGSRSKFGYGRFRYTAALKIGAHRVAAMIKYGGIPDGICVMHSCDNPACVNPAHLFLGTLADNNRDRAKKGRSRDQRGEKHHNNKLTSADVLEIRQSTLSQVELANLYGVSSPTICDIVSRRTWKHI